ncbi:MAG: aldo/keto reductase [Ruminococcaceae bacterium]|nr:aldo/keto reductase [Oscillospiraceae bacterium]
MSGRGGKKETRRQRPVGNGFLSGKYNANSNFENGTDFRSRMPQYTEEGFAAARELMKYLDILANEKGAAPGQVSLAWMICKKPYMIPIPGSRKEERLRENLGSKDITLSEKELNEIDKLLDRTEMPVYGQNSKK